MKLSNRVDRDELTITWHLLPQLWHRAMTASDVEMHAEGGGVGVDSDGGRMIF